MFLYLFCSDRVAVICDSLFYVSPITIVSFLVLSRLLKMCVWHRIACGLPAISIFASIVDRYVVEFPMNAGIATICISVGLFILLLLCAYKVFIR